MTPTEMTELEALAPASPGRLVGLENLTDRSARTLLYGYTTQRHTWHVYLDAQGTLHRLVYSESRGTLLLLNYSSGETAGCVRNDEYVPDKRLYPESCDHEFCALLKDAGVSLPFTAYDAESERRRLLANGGFAGAIREEFDDHEAEYLAYDRAHAGLINLKLAERCVAQAVLELQIPCLLTDSGLFAQGHLMPSVHAWLDTQVDLFDGAEPATDESDLLDELRELARSLGAFHEDAVRAWEVSASAGVVQAQLHLGHALDDARLKRAAALSGLEGAGQDGAWRISHPDRAWDMVLLPQLAQPGTYRLLWKQFGSDASFQAQYLPALQHMQRQQRQAA